MTRFSTAIISVAIACMLAKETAASYATFQLQMTAQQYNVHFSAYIAEWFDTKKCFVRAGEDPDACINYCYYTYYYVQNQRYKNARRYNYTNRQCQFRPVCEQKKGLFLNQDGTECQDINKTPIDKGVDAQPGPPGNTFKVTVVCQHGIQNAFKGKQDCKCDYGWGSLSYPSTDSYGNKKLVKCNQKLPLWIYLPNYTKIYYDNFYDNIFPYGDEPDYWTLALLYYVRDLKYKFITFFVPFEVQMMMIIFPSQPTLKPLDWIWFIWLWIVFGAIFIVTLYEHLINKIKKL